MGEFFQLDQALAEMLTAGTIEVHENGRWLAALTDLHYEVRSDERRTLIHLWSDELNLVRRVLRVAEQSAERIVLEVQRFGRSKPDKLEFVSTEAERSHLRVAREKFCDRFRRILATQFPDEQLDSLTTSADLEHSFSGCLTRGLMRCGPCAWAILGASCGEAPATIDSALTYGLIWLDWARSHARGRAVAGLRLFLPTGGLQVTQHRLTALASSVRIELYELDEARECASCVVSSDIGNLATWLTPRRDVEQTLVEASAALEELRQLAPDEFQASVPPGTHDVALRFRGLEWARWHNGKVFFGLGDERRELTNRNEASLRKLLRQLRECRRAPTPDTNHPLYRAQAERWLESMVQADATRVDARLDTRHLYAQVPAFAATDRGVIDLLGVTQQGRLVVMELKAAEDIHLVLQGVDYWLRVRWHQQQDDFHRFGYFTGVDLQEKPPLLYLVAPTFRFHPSTDTILRYLSPEVEVVRVGLNETWRQGLRVILRQ